MPTDSNGNYSLPEGYRAIQGETIQPNQHNPPLEDLEDAMTARVMRSGNTPFTGPQKFIDGTVGASGIQFMGGGGFYKTTTGIGFSLLGVNVLDIGPAGVFASSHPASETVAGLSGLATNVEAIAGVATHHIVVSGGAGTFTDGETVTATGGGSGIYVAAVSTASVFSIRAGTGAFTGTLTGGTSGATKAISSYAPVVISPTALLAALSVAAPRGYIDGCTLSNGTDTTNDLNIAAGVCRDSTNTVNINVAAMAGKQLDANWAPGAGAGMRNSAAGIADGTYHIHTVSKADGTQDIYAHTSTTIATVLAALQAETGGSAYVYARRIASIIRAGATILQFVQDGDEFQLKTPVVDENITNLTTTGQTLTLESVPNGIRVRSRFHVFFTENTQRGAIYLSDLSCADVLPASDGTAPATLSFYGLELTSFKIGTITDVWTNTSRQIRGRSENTHDLNIVTLGWLDRRAV